jgi:multidrug transporter EmrE-like cation transporter
VKTLCVAILSILFSVAAQFSLRIGMSSTEAREALVHPSLVRICLFVLLNKFVLAGFFLYGVGALVWLGVLAKWEVSKAYPLVGFGFALTAVLGLASGEHVTIPRALGIALVCAGVFLVARS